MNSYCCIDEKKTLLPLFSNMHQEPLHKSKKKLCTLFPCVFPWTSWIGGRPLPGRSPPPPDAALKLTHPDADSAPRGKPGLKGKCWEPQEPQRTSDCSAIILPRLSCTWKGKQKTSICPIQWNQYAQAHCQLFGLAAGQHCYSAFLITFTLCSNEEQVCTWKKHWQRL